MIVTQFCLGLHASSGGASKAARSFAAALPGPVVSWVDPAALAREPLIWETSTLVRASRLPVLRQLLVPRRGDLAAAEAVVAGSDLVCCHSLWRWHCLWLRAAARRHAVPYLFVPHGGLDPWVFERNALVKRLYLRGGGLRFVQESAAVVCATRREHEKLAPFLAGTPAAVLPWPLDADDFRTRDEESRGRIRARLGIPDRAACLLFFGRLDPMKRPLETIDALADSRTDAHLLVVGNEWGVSVADCVRRADRRGIAGRVHVVGPAWGRDRDGYLDAADVYVSLSHRENFNFTAAECLASGLPVILSPGNDLAADLAAVNCGWMLAAGDSPARAIEQAVAAGPAALVSLGQSGRGWEEANLRFDVFQDRIRALAAGLARRPGAGPPGR